ncbi:MAG TPA: hypothetical protein DEB40_09080 [Elusimicrobia bacterium]|nr:hypothetical protein [Elusimicrobiota bacterium]HBT61881.1 hypothetical protein [Elusimicrobiota bacterium]
MSPRCYSCGSELASNAFGRGGHCPGCGADTRCCRNCVFEEPTYRAQCRETQAEPVRDPESANYCDYFRPNSDAGPVRRTPRPQSAVKDSWDALFRKPPTE